MAPAGHCRQTEVQVYSYLPNNFLVHFLRFFVQLRSGASQTNTRQYGSTTGSYQEVQKSITSKSSAVLFQIVKSAHLETIPRTLIIYEKTAANSTHPDGRFRRTLFMNFPFFLGKERPPF